MLSVFWSWYCKNRSSFLSAASAVWPMSFGLQGVSWALTHKICIGSSTPRLTQSPARRSMAWSAGCFDERMVQQERVLSKLVGLVLGLACVVASVRPDRRCTQDVFVDACLSMTDPRMLALPIGRVDSGSCHYSIVTNTGLRSVAAPFLSASNSRNVVWVDP